jgi:hypothetical protein
LLSDIRDQVLVLALAFDIKPERPLAAVVEPLLGPMALSIADPLADAVALILRNGPASKVLSEAPD